MSQALDVIPHKPHTVALAAAAAGGATITTCYIENQEYTKFHCRKSGVYKVPL